MLTVQHIHLQHKGGALKPISSVGARRLKLHSVHSCPNGDKWQVNTANGLSLYWSAAHFSFHNNNARGESSLLGLLVREWLGEEIGPVIILSSTCPSCGVPPSLTRRLLNPDEILTQQRLACYSWSVTALAWLFLVDLTLRDWYLLAFQSCGQYIMQQDAWSDQYGRTRWLSAAFISVSS